MSERDSSEFETSEFCLKTETRVSVQKHKKWILTGLSFLNKSRGWISTNLVPVPTQIQISGSRRWVDCRTRQLQKISHQNLSFGLQLQISIKKKLNISTLRGTASELSQVQNCRGIFYPTDFLFFYSFKRRFHIGKQLIMR